MPIDMDRLGWMMAQWNFSLYFAVGAIVYAMGGLDPVMLAG